MSGRAETTTTTCGYCGVGCRLEAHTAEDRITSITPRRDGPANRGHACLKGRFAHAFTRSSDRLTAPLIRERDGLRPASWEEAIGLIADRLTEIKAEHGADAIAGLASSRATNEDCYAMARLMRAAIGTNNIDNCSRVCHSPTSFALRRSLGLSGATGSFDDIEAAEVAIIIGANPTQAHPVVGARIKQAALRGLRLITIDPRRIELADYGELHLSPRPGTNAAVLLGLAHVLVRDGLIDEQFIAARTEGYAELCALLEQYPPDAVEEISRRPGGRSAGRRAPLWRRDACIDHLGARRDRAQVRLGGRAADQQPRDDVGQHRPARRGAVAAARPEQRAGLLRHGRAAGHVHRVPQRRRRAGRAELRGRVGRADFHASPA